MELRVGTLGLALEDGVLDSDRLDREEGAVSCFTGDFVGDCYLLEAAHSSPLSRPLRINGGCNLPLKTALELRSLELAKGWKCLSCVF